MDSRTFGQTELDADLLGVAPFLLDGAVSTIEYYGDEPLSVRIRRRSSTDRRGRAGPERPDRRQSFKPAILDSSIRVMVPRSSRSGQGHRRPTRNSLNILNGPDQTRCQAPPEGAEVS